MFFLRAICFIVLLYECASAKANFSALSIEAGMDTSVKPCDDFYKFVCGNWGNHTISPSAFQHQGQEVYEFLHSFFKTAIASPTYPRWVNSAIKFYQSCERNEEQEEDSRGQLKKLLARMGGWPVLGKKSSWMESSYSLNAIGRQILPIVLSYISHTQDAKADDFYSLKSKKNIELLHNITAALQSTSSKPQLERDIAEVQSLQDTLQSFLKTNTDRSPRVMSIGKLQELIPAIDWLSIIEQFYRKQMKVSFTSEVVVMNLQSIKTTFDVLANKRTSKRAVANFLGFLAARDRPISLSQTKLKDQSSFNHILRPTCFHEVEILYESALDYLFVQHVDRIDVNALQDIAKYAKDALASIVRKSKWLDPKAKLLMNKRIGKMYGEFGYPSYFSNKSAFDSMHDKFPEVIEGNSANPTRLQVLDTLAFVRVARSRVRDYPFLGPIRIPDSYFDYKFYRYIISLPLLRPPFYYPNGKKWLNFATFGNMVTQAMQLAFAPWEGVMNNTMSKKEYIKRLSCFDDQYNKYAPDFIRLPLAGGRGPRPMVKLHHSRNAAAYDDHALRQAFKAYKLWKKSHKKAERTSTILKNYTNLQRFFISYGSTLCAKSLELAKTTYSDSQVPKYYRLIGSVSNSNGFSKAFNCRKKQPMNPVQKCRLW